MLPNKDKHEMANAKSANAKTVKINLIPFPEEYIRAAGVVMRDMTQKSNAISTPLKKER